MDTEAVWLGEDAVNLPQSGFEGDGGLVHQRQSVKGESFSC